MLRPFSIPLAICALLFLFSVFEGALYFANGEKQYLTGLGVFFLELSMLVIDMVYSIKNNNSPNFHNLNLQIFLILVAITLLLVFLIVLFHFIKLIEKIFIGDKMLKVGLRRIKSILTLLIPLEITNLLEALNWALSEKGMFGFLGDNIEIVIWNSISISTSVLWVFLFVFTIRYINEFREISSNDLNAKSKSDK